MAEQRFEKVLKRFRDLELNHGDQKECEKLLMELKLGMLDFTLIPPFPDENKAKIQLNLARDALELGAFLSVRQLDFEAFGRHVAQLKVYYHDFNSMLEPSKFQFKILGLNLLGLLSHNRIAEFHTELELLSQQALQDECIKFPISLEQAMMEGAYTRVLEASRNAPENFSLFSLPSWQKPCEAKLAIVHRHRTSL
eukprot:GABV01001721.1.p1 GENE.GABV01001721.1~~GABV01001721.1.p1  ORF type:complete len:196 (+),score=40.10 GABV01001721.1:36-623(+)